MNQQVARILVIDDDESIRKSFSIALKGVGYSVDTAADGKEAIEKSNMNFYNLALIDIRLPDMEGTELLTAMRDTFPKMVKIIVTGFPSMKNAIEAVNRGADGFLVKPTDPRDLLRIVAEHLRKQQEAKRYSEEKVKEFVESRAKELEEREADFKP